MTGLSPTHDTVLSLACFVTTAQLTLLHPRPFTAFVYHAPDESSPSLRQMAAWPRRTHSASGLLAACADPARSVPAGRAAADLLAYVQRHVPERGVALLAGNSVHADRGFLAREPWAPVLAHLHPYRLLDVSALKEAARRWCPAGGNEEGGNEEGEGVLSGVPQKEGAHVAEKDVWESIEEARYYRRTIFGGRAEK